MAQIGDRTLIVGDDVVLKVQGTSVGEAHRLRNVLGRLPAYGRAAVPGWL
jgi:hypothetical protein